MQVLTSTYIWQIIFFTLGVFIMVLFIYIGWLLIKALKKYLNEK